MSIELITETGSGLASANTFVTLASATSYHANRGNLSWAAVTTETQKAALIQSSFYLTDGYNWRGYTSTTGQALAWPRQGTEPPWPLYNIEIADGVVANGYEIGTDEVPTVVKRATYELALRAIAATGTEGLMADQDRGGAIAEEQVASIRVKYFNGAPAGTVYRLVDSMLTRADLLEDANTVKLVRR